MMGFKIDHAHPARNAKFYFCRHKDVYKERER